MIYTVAGGDLLKFDEVLKKTVSEVFTYLNFQQRKNELEKDAIDRVRKKK